LRHLIKLIDQSDEFKLQLIVTGTHLSKYHGRTISDIEADGFSINKKINLHLSSDTPLSITESTSLGLKGFATAFNNLKPDLLIVLGDRYEILSAVIAAMFTRLPIAHLHGGELTEGAIDDAIRHSITKCSHLHFVGNEDYMKRVVQLGENPKSVFNVGGLGVDAIKNLKLLNKVELEDSLKINFKCKSILVTFHPVTLEANTSSEQMEQLLKAIKELKDTSIIFTMPNADTDGRAIFDLIENYVSQNNHAFAFKSLGQLRYLSCIKQVDLVIGNSSSGLLEVPTFKKATINIGDRQKGRKQSESIINCSPTKSSILRAISMAYSPKFQLSLINVKNPYGDGGATQRIMDTLHSVDFNNLIKKPFFDL
jgi:GDP/UDP-N,N'-diacetylbacillosamine 2-epimerase (hydrolysing)